MNVSATDGTGTLPRESQLETVEGPSIEAIIARGRRSRPGALPGFGLAIASGLLIWASFAPLDIGPLAWISLVPLLLLARPRQRTFRMYRLVFLAGLISWLLSLQWVRLGHSTMYGAWFALSIYLALYWPTFLALVRVAVHRLGIPLILAVPVLWTGLEYLRSFLLTGFSWYYLGHSQYRWVEIIQISDLAGGYAVSFLVALANAAIAQLIPVAWLERLQLCWPSERSEIWQASRRGQWVGVILSVVLVLAAVGYGIQRRQVSFQQGPRVGLVQGNFPSTVGSDRDQWSEILQLHRDLTAETLRYRPDFVVWPEGMFRYPLWEYQQGMTDDQLRALNPEFPLENWKNTQVQQALADLADMAGAGLIVGICNIEAKPERYFVHNSAVFVQPGAGVTTRYDKIHLVPFGEYIPLKRYFSFLSALTPFRGDFGADPGTRGEVFRYRDWTLVPLICFEDTVPQLVRGLVRSAGVNDAPGGVLVNLTNDGWFHGSSELQQHLVTAAFRCVETRTPMVRAVNTGISALIDGDGVIREPYRIIDLDARRVGEEPRSSMRDPQTGRFHRQWNCALVVDVPLDPRRSLYVTGGDWLGFLCLASAGMVGFWGIRLARRERRENRASAA